MILLLDNYDSFTYNLYQQIGQLYEDITVIRNDKITVQEITRMQPQAIIISPGPGYPQNAGVSVAVVQNFSGKIPILGVCLGHQAIAQGFGGKIVRAKQLMHGKASNISVDNSCTLFKHLPQTVSVARYHSLIAEQATLPKCLTVTATDEVGQIMALAHNEHPTYGVQFHPESILTKDGMQMIENFLCYVAKLNITPLHAEKNQLPPAQRNALKPYIFKVIEGANLTEQEAYDAMDCIMNGCATDAQIGSFTTALRMKGETVDELTGFAKVMRQKAATVKGGTDAVDIVGTGGDMANTFNISTTAAFVTAGAGLRVAKHGNRSVSSKSGSADVLEKLGVNIQLTPEQATSCLEQCGICFLFAQKFHGSMKFAAPSRREVGVRTVFNILGPLANPALTNYMVLGVYEKALMEPMARVLMNLGMESALIVHGNDGLDEVTLSTKTAVCQVQGNKLIQYEIAPQDFGIPCAEMEQVVGGTAAENAVITLEILNGKHGPQRDIVVLNAACALYAGKKAESIAQGVQLAQQAIDSGKALAKLEALKTVSMQFAEKEQNI